jgi:hypothetical protein
MEREKSKGNKKKSGQSNYEKLLQKAENDIRLHISVS